VYLVWCVIRVCLSFFLKEKEPDCEDDAGKKDDSANSDTSYSATR
jgi:hypothetical protein